MQQLAYLARQLAVANVELAEHVAGRQRHLVEVCGVDDVNGGLARAIHSYTRTSRVPRGQNDAAVVGVGLDGVDDAGKLIDTLAGVVSVEVDILGTVR